MNDCHKTAIFVFLCWLTVGGCIAGLVDSCRQSRAASVEPVTQCLTDLQAKLDVSQAEIKRLGYLLEGKERIIDGLVRNNEIDSDRATWAESQLWRLADADPLTWFQVCAEGPCVPVGDWCRAAYDFDGDHDVDADDFGLMQAGG